MSGFRLHSALIAACVVCQGTVIAQTVFAQDEPAAEVPEGTAAEVVSETSDAADEQAEASDAAKGGVSIPFGAIQPADDEVGTLDPIVTRDESTRRRLEAVAHYMSGLTYEKRRDPAAALEEYAVSLELNPEAEIVYRSYVPIAYLLGQSDKSLEAAREAATRFDKGHDLVRGLAAMMAGTDRDDDAISLLKETLNIPRVRDARMSKLLVHRDLGVILRSADQDAEAAQQLRIVFEESQSTDKPLTAEQVKQLFGEGGESYEEMGSTFLDAELPDLAVKAFEKAAEADPSTPAVHSYNLASVFQRTGRPEQALEQLQIYLNAELQTKGRDAYELLADLLKELDREAELGPKLKSLVEVDRRNTSLRYFYADFLRDSGNLTEAEEQYRIALGGGRDLRGLIGLMSIIRSRNADTEDAVKDSDGEELAELMLKAYPIVAQSGRGGKEFEAEWAEIKEHPKLLDALASAARAKIDGDKQTLEFFPAYVFGRLMIDAKRADDAAAFYRYALKTRTDPPIQLYVELGDFLEDEEQYKIAAEVYAEAIESAAEQGPELRAELLYRLSNTQVQQGLSDEAFASIREAQSLAPDDLRWQFWEGVIASEAKEFDQAVEIYKAFIAQHGGKADEDPMVERARFQLSVVYVKQGQIDLGADVLLEILEQDPNNVQANNDLGYLWADEGVNLERAEKMIRKAFAAEPENPAYIDSLGWILHRLGKSDEAIPHLEKAKEHENGRDTVIFEHLGDAYEASGRKADAIDAYQTAIEIEREKTSPEKKEIERIQKKLDTLKSAR